MPTTVNEPSDSTTPPGFGRPPLPLPPPYPSTRPLSPAGIPASSSLRPPAPAGFAASAASDSSAARHASLSAHQWNEPPLAQPKASYREYDDKAFMNASTLHMQPLGEMPSAKMLEATKRPYPHQPKKQKGVKPAFFLNIQQSNGNGASKDASIISSPSGDAGGGGAGPGGGGEEGGEGGEGGGDSGAACIAGGDSVPGAVATPQESNVRTFTVPSAPPVRPSPNQPPSFAVMTPVTKPSTPTTAASPSASSRAAGSPTIAATGSSAAGPRHPPAAAGWMNGQTPSSKTEQGRARLSMVVDAAIQRSSLVGNVELGKAIKKLYDESLENNELADLLDAVLAQNARPDQIHQFQTYVRYARENPEQRVTGRDRPAALPATTRTAAPLSVSTPTRPTAMAPIKVEPTEQRQGLNGAVGVSQIERRVGSDATATYTELQPGEHHNGRMDSDSDMRSVSVETGNGPNSTPALGKRLSHQRQLERDLRDNDSEHPEKRAKTIVPEDASTRDPGSVQSRTRGRKRQRSPSMTSPVPPVESGPPSSTSSYAGQSVPQTLPPSQHPPKKKNKQSKFKISPIKKATALENTVVTAGIGETADQRRQRYGSEEVSENEDVCAVCNGQGRFVCCDRCPRSFHFSCLNPPVEDCPEGMWFCNRCTAQTSPPPKEPRGLFSELMHNIKMQNPTSFRLPVHIRNYFMGVETGPLGEYVDIRDTKTQKYSKSGFLEEYDTHRLKDKHSRAILCHDCGKSAVDGQRIVSCDYCPLSWHMDCISPMPMSNPPASNKKWMCPAHTDWILNRRRPKKAPVIDANLRRGFKNNGLIEIENEPEPEVEEQEFEKIEMNGVVYRLPERGIKLDFLHNVKVANEKEYLKKQREPSPQPPQPPQPSESSATVPMHAESPAPISEISQASPVPQTPPELKDRSLVDRHIIDALIELRSQLPDCNLHEGSLTQLFNLLLEAASPDIAALLGATSAERSSDQEKQQLLQLQELIQLRLQTITGDTPPAQVDRAQQTDIVPHIERAQQTEPIKQAEKMQQTEAVLERDQMQQTEPELPFVPEYPPVPMPHSGFILGPSAHIPLPRMEDFHQEAPVAMMAPVAPMAPMAFMAPPPDLSTREMEELMNFDSESGR